MWNALGLALGKEAGLTLVRCLVPRPACAVPPIFLPARSGRSGTVGLRAEDIETLRVK